MKKIICQLHGVWKLQTDWYIRTEKDFNKTVWNMQKYILAYKMHPQYQQSHNPLTPKGAYLGKCPNCPWGSGIMVTTERQIWGAIQL